MRSAKPFLRALTTPHSDNVYANVIDTRLKNERRKSRRAPRVLSVDSPLELFDRDGDLQVVPEDVQGREDVGPLHHLSQRPAFQNLRTEDVARFLRQETHVHQNLQRKNKQRRRLAFLIPQEPHLGTSRELKHTRQGVLIPSNALTYPSEGAMETCCRCRKLVQRLLTNQTTGFNSNAQ